MTIKGDNAMKYVAVVMKNGSSNLSHRPEGDWGCFVGDTREEAVTQALESRKKWAAKGYSGYAVLVGKLYTEAKEVVNYVEVDLERSPARPKVNIKAENWFDSNKR
jgi:hypothetical protein